MAPDSIQLGRSDVDFVIRARTAHVSCLCASAVGENVLLGERLFAQQRPTWVISGSGQTSGQGEAELSMNVFLDIPSCAHAVEDNYGPAIIGRGLLIATPRHDSPVLLTHTLVTTEKDLGFAYRDFFSGDFLPGRSKEWDVVVKVRSWGLNSASSPSVVFSWIYIAEAALRYRFV